MKKKKAHSTARGDLMRQIAMLHAQSSSRGRNDVPDANRRAERAELAKQIAKLEQQLLK